MLNTEVLEQESSVMEGTVIESELQQRISELSTLNTLMQQVNACLSLNEVVQAALKGIVPLISPDMVMIFLSDGEDLVLHGLHSADPDYQHEDTQLHKLGECLCGSSAKSGKALYSYDIHSDSRCTWHECKMAGFRSFAALPLLSEGKTIGVLGLASGRSNRDFSLQSTFLETLSNGIAIGLQNAILYEEVNKSRDKLIEANKLLETEIDERSKTEKELEQAQRIAQLGSWDWNILSDKIFWSDEVYSIFGLFPNLLNITYKKFLSFVHPGDTLLVEESIKNAISNNVPYSIDHRIVLPEGGGKIVHAQAEVAYDGNGKAIRVFGTIQDVTDRKVVENALKVKNSFLRLLQVAAISANRSAEIEDAFKPILHEVCRCMGWPIGHAFITSKEKPDLLEPTSIWYIENPECFTAFIDHTNKIKFEKGRGLPGLVLEYKTPQWITDVTTHPNFPRANTAKSVDLISGFAFPVMVGTEVVAALEFFTTESVQPDLTFMDFMSDVGTELGRVVERKRAEDGMRYLRNLLKNVTDSMPSVLVTVDYNGRIMQWNREAEKYTGVSVKDARCRKLNEIFTRPAIAIEKVQEVIECRTPSKDENMPRKIKGETRFYDLTIYPLISSDVKGAVIRIDDVTERVRMEEIMIQSEKMLSVGGLAAGMAHEINNPLAGILQSAQVVLDRISSDLQTNQDVAMDCGTEFENIKEYVKKREVKSMVEAIRLSGQRAAKIVDNMLSFSRKSVSDFMPHSLKDLLDQTLELASNEYDLRKKYDFRQIEIERKYELTLPPVNCEKTKIQQVILNVLKNGAQAMAEDDTTNKKPRFVIRTLLDNKMARIDIEDNGPGMDHATRKRVFEPFFSTKDVGIGTGLGLSVSYFIITENHGGSMAVESTPGKGTKFVIRLPFNIN